MNPKYADKDKPVPVPRVMSLKDQVTEFGKIRRPEGFSVITKSWLPRRKYAGTFDEKWLKERHPLMPGDFDPIFYNCAHPDMIYDGYLKGNEHVVLINLHPTYGTLRFSLPAYSVGLLLRYTDGAMAIAKAESDTLHIEATGNRAYLVWRTLFIVGKPLRVIEARMTVPDQKETKHG